MKKMIKNTNNMVNNTNNNVELFNDFKPIFSWNMWDATREEGLMPEDFAKPVNMTDDEWADLQDSLYILC